MLLISTTLGDFSSFFFGKECGWCWCQCAVHMWLSQWLSVACWNDAKGRPEVTTETTRLSANIALWKLVELICASHIGPLSVSVTRMLSPRTSWTFLRVSFECTAAASGAFLRALSEDRRESLIPPRLVISQTLRWNKCTNAISTLALGRYLKLTKKGKWKRKA